MFGTIVGFIVIALIGGFGARALKPGKDPMSVPQTLLLGAVGSLVGGFLGRLIGNDKADGFFQPSSWFGSIIGALIVLLLWTKFGKNLMKR